MSKVSFGALAKAQDALLKDQSANRKRKRGEDTSKSQEDKLEALRERLRQIKAEKLASGPQSSKKTKSKTFQDEDSEEDESEDSNDDSGSDGAPRVRSSKHAPAVQSSKRMVSRKRKIVEVKKPVFRDPRFENVSGPRPDENTIDKRYAFLNDYRASEIADLRATIKKTKNEGEKERLKKKLLSMESQEQTRKRKEEQQNVVREHKKKEKELIKQGKQPFYLKKCTYPREICAQEQFNAYILTLRSSRAKEDRIGRSLPEHEIEATRQGHRTSPQEDYRQGTEEHARRTTKCIVATMRKSTVAGRIILRIYPFEELTAEVMIPIYHLSVAVRQELDIVPH